MPGDAFLGGVELGGLTDASQIKILVCIILDEVGEPILRDDLLEAVAGQGCANYFETADAMSELATLGHVTVLDEWYSLAPSGSDIVSLLAGDVALTVRERAVAAAKTLARRRRIAQNNRVTITEHAKDGGCTVHCAVCEKSGKEIFSVSLEVPTHKAALKVRERFVDRAEEVMRFAVEQLAGEEL